MLVLTDENYYSVEADCYMSVSQWKVWQECPARAYAQYVEHSFSPPDMSALGVGAYFHALCLEPEAADATLVEYADVLTTGKGAPNARAKEAAAMAEYVLSLPDVARCLEGERERAFVYEFGGILWKSKLDVLNLERKEIWAFVSGGLFYILIGLAFLWQFIKGKMSQKKFLQQYKNDEWFDIVTPQGKVVGKAPRTLCHGNPNLLHPVVHVHVFNSRGELWLQKRAADKKIQPGKWDTSVGGHVSSGEKISEALLREVKEELGIDMMPNEPLYNYVMKNEIESELVYTFRGIHNGPFQWPKNENETGKFWKIKEIRRNLGRDVFTPNFEQEFGFLEKLKLV